MKGMGGWILKKNKENLKCCQKHQQGDASMLQEIVAYSLYSQAQVLFQCIPGDLHPGCRFFIAEALLAHKQECFLPLSGQIVHSPPEKLIEIFGFNSVQEALVHRAAGDPAQQFHTDSIVNGNAVQLGKCGIPRDAVEIGCKRGSHIQLFPGLP